MDQITNLFDQRRAPEKRRRTTERSELFDVILSRVNPSRIKEGDPPLTHGRLGYLLAGIDTKSLYALLSKMRDGERRGVAAGAILFTEIRPEKY